MKSMSNRLTLLLAAMLGTIVLGGCSPTRTEEFDITLRNKTPRPLLLNLAKDGPPLQLAWATPEDLSRKTPEIWEDWKSNRTIPLLEPGKTATIHKLTGRFDAGTHAFLRVYAGDLNVAQMLSK